MLDRPVRALKPTSTTPVSPAPAEMRIDPEQEYKNFYETDKRPSYVGPSVSISTAVLHVFSPQRQPDFTVRPHVHDFNPATLAYIVDRVQHEPSVRPSYHDTNEHITAAIKPTNDYKYLAKLSELDDCYTFVLTFDEVDRHVIRNMNRNPPVTRYVLMGLVIDEPVSANNTPNHRALLKILKVSSYRIDTLINQDNPVNLSSIASYDVVAPTKLHGLTDGMMAKLTPSAYVKTTATSPLASRESFHYNYEDEVRTEATIMPVINDPVRVHTEYLSPYQEMLVYLSAIQTGRDNASSPTSLPDFEADMQRGPGRSIFHHTANNKLIAQDTVASHHRLLEGSSITIGQLLTMFPTCDIQPYKVPGQLQYDIYPSEANKLKNIYHAWITDTIHYIAKEFGIVEFKFDYNSRVGNYAERNADIHKREGAWNVTSLIPISNLSPIQRSALFNTVSQYLEITVFKHIKSTIGDFALFAFYRGTAPTVVSLNFNDVHDHDAGSFYASPVNLGGMCSPSVGDLRTYVNNASNLDNLMRNVDRAIEFTL